MGVAAAVVACIALAIAVHALRRARQHDRTPHLWPLDTGGDPDEPTSGVPRVGDDGYLRMRPGVDDRFGYVDPDDPDYAPRTGPSNVRRIPSSGQAG